MLKILSSLNLFFALCLALGVTFIYQTVFSAGPSVYGSPWFAALGALLAANIAACSARRLRTASAASLLIHAGLVLVILGAFASRALRFEGELPLRVGTGSDRVYSGNAVYQLPFSIRLEDFRLEYYGVPSGKITIRDRAGGREFPVREGSVITLPERKAELKVLKLARDFGLNAKNEVFDKSPYWHNPAAQVEIALAGKKKKLWFFANLPASHRGELPFSVSYGLENAYIKNFTSAVLVHPAGGAAFSAEISVNKPLKTGGYTVYQSSYDPAEAGYSLLTVKRDRGLWAVYAGFAALLTGIFLWLKR
ncbi:MAG: cytochrome c biogenesis protein ResB [Elusimicrobiota bacterium]|nr:cytochrome c biogenesis protein ResB [Elusimicrobiota bacterium]